MHTDSIHIRKLSTIFLPFFVFPAPGDIWVGAIHPALCWIPNPIRPPQRQWEQDELMGEEVLWNRAEKPGPLLWSLGLACPEGNGWEPGPPALLAESPHEGVHECGEVRDVEQEGQQWDGMRKDHTASFTTVFWLETLTALTSFLNHLSLKCILGYFQYNSSLSLESRASVIMNLENVPSHIPSAHPQLRDHIFRYWHSLDSWQLFCTWKALRNSCYLKEHQGFLTQKEQSLQFPRNCAVFSELHGQ